VTADKDKVARVLSNLLDNAIKFTPSGDIMITAQEDYSTNKIIVRIRDTGTGIDSEIYPKIFQKFTTKSIKGTGLGLYISKNIVEAHGGDIIAENNEGGVGATFSFSLPMTSSVD
jgi:two-component system, OmpR family, sensor histidine kinase VicK